MIVYLLCKGFLSLTFALVSIIPIFETPIWFSTQLPDVLYRIASFNWYLPVYETVSVVIFLISFTLAYKVLKVILNFVHIDLNS